MTRRTLLREAITLEVNNASSGNGTQEDGLGSSCNSLDRLDEHLLQASGRLTDEI